MKLITLAVVVTLALAGCSQPAGVGSKATITCYSGGANIFTQQAAGNIHSRDGIYEFRDLNGQYVAVSGDCVVRVYQ